MSKNTNKNEHITNVKPDSWYEEYLKIENSYLLKHPEAQSKIPLITIEEIKKYDSLANNNYSNLVDGFRQFEKKNNLEMNKKLMVQYKKELESLKLWNPTNNIDELDDGSEEYCLLQTSFKINKCLEALEQGYLITAQLEDIKADVDNYCYNEESSKPFLDIIKQFKFGNYQEELYYFIKQNINWYNKSRDFFISK